MQKLPMSITKLVASITVAVIVVVSACWGWEQAEPVTITGEGETVLVTIKPGTPAKAIAEELYNQNLIRSPLVFRIIAKLAGLENSLQAGEYVVSPSMTVKQMLIIMSEGQTAYRQFTIPEGYTVDQIAELLAAQKLVNAEKFKALAKDYAPYPYMLAQPNSKYRAEGFIFPDTYRVASNVTEEELLAMMVKQFDSQITPTMRVRAEELGLSIREVVIMSSLVEKEAKLPEDRSVIAGVFASRIRMDMPLQSCATIQYILGYPKPELTIQDTQISSPYNTYQNMGLPPGPIANPGRAAMQAVLYPDNTEYLYFVADKEGKHHFSKTYAEHLAAIERVRI